MHIVCKLDSILCGAHEENKINNEVCDIEMSDAHMYAGADLFNRKVIHYTVHLFLYFIDSLMKWRFL